MDGMDKTYRVEGMTCDHCVAHVRQEVGRIPGVSATSLTLSDGLLTVASDVPIDFADIRAAVEEAGEYEVAEA